MRRLLVACVVAVLAGGISTAYADSNPLAEPANPDASTKLKEGNRLYQLADYEGAVAAYKAGYLLEASPLFQYNLGQALRLSGNHAEAIYHYKAFLREANPDGELRLYVEDFIKVLTAKNEKAEVEAAEREKKLADEEKRRNNAEREKVATTPPHESPETDRWYQDGLGWGLVAAGLVGIGVGAGLLVNGASLRDDADIEPDQLKAKTLRDSANTRQLIGGISGGVGGALLIAGVIKLAVAPITPDGVAVTSRIDSDFVLVGLVGRF